MHAGVKKSGGVASVLVFMCHSFPPESMKKKKKDFSFALWTSCTHPHQLITRSAAGCYWNLNVRTVTVSRIQTNKLAFLFGKLW